jgi:quercetin dioxygenase-like cupin family protein
LCSSCSSRWAPARGGGIAAWPCRRYLSRSPRAPGANNPIKFFRRHIDNGIFGSLIAACCAGSLLPQGVSVAQETAGYEEVPTLLRRGETVASDRISYPSDGPALLHSLIVTLKPGERTGRHKHGAPTYAYILSGQVTVEYDGGLRRIYLQGQTFMEPMDHRHDCFTDGADPCRILVVFMGTERSRGIVRSQ